MSKHHFGREMRFLAVVLAYLGVGLVYANQGTDAEYVKSLENALINQIKEKRGQDTVASVPTAPAVVAAAASSPVTPAVEKTVVAVNLLRSDDGNEISSAVVGDVKQLLKEPLLTLLASSEFVSWPEFKKRLEDAKAALANFEVKHKATLDKVVAAGQRAAIPTAPQGMPGIVPLNKPAQKPADDEEEEEEEEEVKPAVSAPAKGMPGALPGGMPGATKVAPAAPAAKPTGMPGVIAPAPAKTATSMPEVKVTAMPVAQQSGMPLAK